VGVITEIGTARCLKFNVHLKHVDVHMKLKYEEAAFHSLLGKDVDILS